MSSLPRGLTRETYNLADIENLLLKTQQSIIRRQEMENQAQPSKSHADAELVRQLTQAVCSFSDGREETRQWAEDRAVVIQLYSHLAGLSPEAALAAMPVVLEHAEPLKIPALLQNIYDAAKQVGPTSEMVSSVKALWKRHIREEVKPNEGIATQLLKLQAVSESLEPGGFKQTFDEVLEKDPRFSEAVLYILAREKDDIFAKDVGITREEFLELTIDRLKEQNAKLALANIRRKIGDELFKKLAHD